MENKLYYTGNRKDMAAFIPKKCTKVLELGCGEGVFIKNFSYPVEYWGIEPVRHIANAASNKLYKVLFGKYEDVYSQLPDNYFDLVVCNDVIEHLIDHDYFFDSIKLKMKKKAYLIASIPNVRFYKNLYNLLFMKEWKYAEHGILDRTHLRFFTDKSLKRTLTEHGYKIEKFEYINPAKRWYQVKGILFNLTKLITFGYFKDIRFLRFGFRAVKENS